MLTIKYNPAYYEWIEEGFAVLLENPSSQAGLDLVKKGVEHLFPYQFQIRIIHPNPSEELYVMSVYPDKATIDKVIEMLTKGNDQKVIQKLWESNKNWTIEIDDRVLQPAMGLTKRELTAVICHEIGHVVASNSITQRITNILEYELTKSSLNGRILIRDKFFRGLLSLPVLQACTMEKNTSIKKEMEADKMAVKAGYRSDLLSVMQKFQKQGNYHAGNDDKQVRQMAHFSTSAMDQFKKRETSLLESTLEIMEKVCPSVVVSEYVHELRDFYFRDDPATSMTKEKKINFYCERAEQITEEDIMEEFFGFKKSLKPMKAIDQNELDYITIKIKSMKTTTDQMMLVSYCNSKLDIINYYLSILNNPEYAGKAQVLIPHTRRELEYMKERLLQNINQILNYKLPDPMKGLLVAWPANYEG